MNEHLFNFCPKCGNKSIEFLNGQNWRCKSCDFSFFLDAAAAVAVIAEHNGKILFERRAKLPRQGFLALPGGFVDKGESLEKAGHREFFEETGLKCGDLTYFCSFHNFYEYKGVVYPTCDSFFLTTLSKDCDLTKFDAGEVSSLEWISEDEIPMDEIAFDSTKWALERLLRTKNLQCKTL